MGELGKIGIEVAKSTVERYPVRRRKPSSPTWRAFLRNHIKEIVAVDFFVVPTVQNQVLFAARSPWQSPFIERLIGTIRRECLHHVVVINEKHLERTLSSYFRYYHRSWTLRGVFLEPPGGAGGHLRTPIRNPQTGTAVLPVPGSTAVLPPNWTPGQLSVIASCTSG